MIKQIIHNMRLWLKSSPTAYCSCYNINDEEDTMELLQTLLLIDTRNKNITHEHVIVCPHCKIALTVSKYGVAKERTKD